ncbi:Pan3 protein [Saccharomycopsis crataegensis]|uniref:PAN2-PAN3 deadenylation complex subunit PAN3 n=1 Tax=Saccharomycopsis crataegensis TaxID=43959 RepID=A0AAV5QV38_9ASCO|nr:Pan3 protein [Saccharomycopsis crataegensis]
MSPAIKSSSDMDWAKNVPCKNITIFGFCKFENKGCAFNHGRVTSDNSQEKDNTEPKPTQGTISSVSSAEDSNSGSSTSNNGSANSSNGNGVKFNPDSMSFKPATQSKFQKLSANLSDIPSFIPSTNLASASVESFHESPSYEPEGGVLGTPEKNFTKLGTMASSYNFDNPGFQPTGSPVMHKSYLKSSNAAIPSQSPSSQEQQQQAQQLQLQQQQPPNHQKQQAGSLQMPSATPHSLSSPIPQMNHPSLPISQPMTPVDQMMIPPLPQDLQASVNQPQAPSSHTGPSSQIINPYSSMPSQPPEMYFTPPSVSYPLQYHLYAPTSHGYHRGNYLSPNERDSHSLFIPNDLRETLLKKNEATLQTIQHSNLPEYISVFHTLVPLDKTLKKSIKSYGVPNSLYKVFSNKDGNPYVLRRLEGFQLTNEKSLSIINHWKQVSEDCGNIVKIKEAFTSLAFGDNSLYFVHDFYPLVKTLREAHQGKVKSVPETLLWDYIAQITNALVSIHSKNLAARLLNWDKFIVTGANRIKFSGCGISDIINYDQDSYKMTQLDCANRIEYYTYLQKDDLRQFGELIVELIRQNNGLTTSSLEPSVIDSLSYYSDELKSAIKYLLGFEHDTPTISEFSSRIVSHILNTMNQLSEATDTFESTLANEIENDRLVRLLTKINFVIDRPEFEGDLSWSETGERYPIKLFYDYVFHQTDQEDKPVMDLVHVLSCLNKLDVGVDERVLLVSRDEGSCIIASYKELKNCIDSSFRALSKR